jgi:hypothetical protein
MHTRRNAAISVFNSIIMGWPIGWNLDGSTGIATDLNYSGASPKAFVSTTILAGNSSSFLYSANAANPTGWTTTDLGNYFSRSGSGNSVLATNTEAGLVAPFKYDSSVDFSAVAGGAAALGGDFTNTKLAPGFFTSTSFRGAAGVADTWWKTWTSFQ